MLFLWIGLSLLVGAFGSSRKIGFWGAFIVSLLLSPLGGLIVSLISISKAELQREEALKHQQDLNQKLTEMQNQHIPITDQLEKLSKLKNDGVINEEEYQKLKNKIVGL